MKKTIDIDSINLKKAEQEFDDALTSALLREYGVDNIDDLLPETEYDEELNIIDKKAEAYVNQKLGKKNAKK